MLKLVYIIAIATICHNLRSVLAETCNDAADVPHYNKAQLAGNLWPHGNYVCNGITLKAQDLKWWLETYTPQKNFWFGTSCNDKPKKYTGTLQYRIGDIPQACFPPDNEDNWSGWNAFTKDYKIDENHNFKVWGVAMPVFFNENVAFEVVPCAIVLQTIYKKDATFESCPFYPEDQ